jgi:membrane-associated phospholipid phosphatase
MAFSPEPAPAEPPPPRRARPGRRSQRLVPLSRAATVGLVVVLAAFVVLAVLVASRWRPLIGVDQSAVLAAHRDVQNHPWLLRGADVATTTGSPLVVDIVTVVGGLILLARYRVRAALYLLVTRLAELTVETGVKQVVHRPRPTLLDPVAYATGFSFPSGHAGGSTAVYGAVFVLTVAASWGAKRPAARITAGALALFVVVLVAAVAASRVLLGVHYPSDVTGGVLLGVACLVAACPLQQSPPPPRAGPRS